MAYQYAILIAIAKERINIKLLLVRLYAYRYFKEEKRVKKNQKISNEKTDMIPGKILNLMCMKWPSLAASGSVINI